MTLQSCLVLIKNTAQIQPRQWQCESPHSSLSKHFSHGRVTFRWDLLVCFQSAFPLLFASLLRQPASGRFFLVMLIIVHWKLNCHGKLIAQRQGASNDSLSLLTGLYLNQQLRRDFLFSSLLIPWSSLPLCTDHWLLFCILEAAIFVQSTFLLSFFALLIV